MMDSMLCYVMLKVQVTLVCPMMHQWLAPDQIHSWAFGLMSFRLSRGWGKELSGVSFDTWGITVKSFPFSTGKVSSSSVPSSTKEWQVSLNRMESASSLKERWSVCNPQMGFRSGLALWGLFFPSCKPTRQIAFYSEYDSGSSFRVKLGSKRPLMQWHGHT